MSNVTQLHTWPIHLSHPDDEWEALCGEPSPGMLAEEGSQPLPGFRLCEACSSSRKRLRTSSMSTDAIE